MKKLVPFLRIVTMRQLERTASRIAEYLKDLAKSVGRTDEEAERERFLLAIYYLGRGAEGMRAGEPLLTAKIHGLLSVKSRLAVDSIEQELASFQMESPPGLKPLHTAIYATIGADLINFHVVTARMMGKLVLGEDDVPDEDDEPDEVLH